MENGTSSSIGGLNMEWRSVGDWAVSQCYELKGLRVFTWRRFPTDGPIKPEIGPTGQIGKSGPIPKNRKTEKPDFLDYTGGLRNTTPPGAKVRERRRETQKQTMVVKTNIQMYKMDNMYRLIRFVEDLWEIVAFGFV